MDPEPTPMTPDMATTEDASPVPRLALLRLEVTLDTGEVLETQVLNADLVSFDRTAAKHGWPKPVDAPFLAQTFFAYRALRREGRIPAEWTFDAFADTHALMVRDIKAEANGTEPAAEVVPFPPAPGQG